MTMAIIQGQWRKTAVRMLNEENRYPDIKHLVLFVSTAAEEANDPVFGESGRQTSHDRGTPKPQLIKHRSANFNVQTVNSPSLREARHGF